MKAYHINQRDEGIDLHGVSGALMTSSNMQMQTFVTGGPIAFAQNQRDEVRDLHNVAGAVTAQPGMKQQTFIASFSAGARAKAGGISYSEECSPTLKGSPSGNMMPSVLCLNDQSGGVMGCTEDITGTIRPQEHGHQPLVLDTQPDTALFQENTNTDCQEVFSRQRVDVFKDSDVSSTESARQHKDATDLVYQETVGALTSSDRKGPNSQYVSQEKLVVAGPLLIRRLTPLECERLQGFPDFWTDIPGASDSARFKSLGNSIAVPCVEYIMKRIRLSDRGLLPEDTLRLMGICQAAQQ